MSATVSADPVFEHIVLLLQAITNRRPVIVEIGVHWGQHTPLLLLPCRIPPIYYGFEPDPRNVEILQGMSLDVFPIAISSGAERIPLYMSDGTDPQGRTHTASSSLQRPTGHLQAHPWVQFPDVCEVDALALDDVVSEEHEAIDIIWCDVQGAQRRVLDGARKTLEKTRMLYIEVHPSPMYEDEPTFEELLEMLPGWRVVERYPADVLLENENGPVPREA